MSHLTTIQKAVCACLSAGKTALLEWNEYQIDAARNIFQQRIDPLSGRSHPSAFAAVRPMGPGASKTPEAAIPLVKQKSHQR